MTKRIIARILCVLFSLSLLTLLSGCSLYIASLDKLLRAPMSDPELEKMINKKFGSSITLIAPSRNEDDDDPEYLSSNFNYADLDSDGRDEVICFYSEKASPETIHVLILKSDGEKWSIVSDTPGSGNEITSLRVIELSDRAQKQIVTTWKYVDNMILNVSCLADDSQNGVSLVRMCEDKRFDEIEMVDVDADSYTEMLLLSYDLGTLEPEKVPFLTILDMDEAGNIVPLCRADLPDGCENVEVAYCENTSETPFAIFIDYTDSSDVAHSGLYYWNMAKFDIVRITDGSTVSKLDPAQEKYVSIFNTARFSPSGCADVNNDGMFEIPIAQTFSGQQKAGNRLAYTQWSNVVFNKDGSCTFSEAGSEKRIYFDDVYYLKVPAYFEDGKLFAFYSGGSKWSFIYGDFESAQEAEKNESSCFAVIESVDENDISQYESSGYSLLGSYGAEQGKSLVCKITDYGLAMGLKRDELFNIK